jgi:hypothetical protein
MLREQQSKNVAELNTAIKHPAHLQQKHLTERVPLFLWLVDRREAIFTFKNLEKNEQAYSIRTTDGWLVNNLAVYFEHTLAPASDTFLRTPSYRLTNVNQTPTNNATVIFKGRVDETEGVVVVESIARERLAAAADGSAACPESSDSEKGIMMQHRMRANIALAICSLL